MFKCLGLEPPTEQKEEEKRGYHHGQQNLTRRSATKHSKSRGVKTFWFAIHMVAHGRVVTSSRQITEVKQCRARLVLGWVTDECSSHAAGRV